jgi:CHAT domain-containing protein
MNADHADEVLLTRLRQARHADLDTLLALEPQFGERPFLEYMLMRRDGDTSLTPLAHEVLRRVVGRDAGWLDAYAQLTSERMRHAFEVENDGPLTLRMLGELEHVAHQHGNVEVLSYAKTQRLSFALDEPGRPNVLSAGHALLAVLGTGSGSGEEEPMRRRMSGLLAQAGLHAYYQSKDIEAARAFAEAGCRLHEQQGLLRLVIQVHIAQRRFPAARAWLQRLVERGEAEGVDHYHLGVCAADNGDSQAALDAMLAAVRLSPQNGFYAMQAASRLGPAGRLDEAVAMLEGAMPACEAMLREDPEYSVAAESGRRASLPQVIAMTRLQLADEATAAGMVELAERVIDVLVKDEDSIGHLNALQRLARIRRTAGDPAAATAILDSLAESEGGAMPARLELATWAIEQDDPDRAVAHLAALMPYPGHIEAAMPVLQHVIERWPAHQAARKWMGCALTYPDMGDIPTGVAMLDEVLEADPSDAHARYRRAIGRITWGPGGYEEEQIHMNLAASVRDLGIAVLDAPEAEEYRRAWLWLIDRIAANREVLMALLEERMAPWGMGRVAPLLADALQSIIDANVLAHRRDHRGAVDMLASAQRQLRDNGLPAMAVYCELHSADNLLRIGKLQEARDCVDAYDRTYQSICSLPLTRSLEEEYAAQERKHADAVIGQIRFELEFAPVQTIGFQSAAPMRDLNMAELMCRTGHKDEALAAVVPMEQKLLADRSPSNDDVSRVENIAIILRDAGKAKRALALVEHALSHASPRNRFRLDFFKGTILMQSGGDGEALAHFERLLSQAMALGDAVVRQVQINLASIHADGETPQRAIDLLTPYLSSSGPPRFLFICHLISAKAERKQGRQKEAGEHARRAIGHFFDMTAALADVRDRLGFIEAHDGHVKEALDVLVDGGEAQTVFTIVEALRAQTLDAERRDQGIATKEMDVIERRVAKLRRVRDALQRLSRGVDVIGADFVDADALAEVRREDPHLSLFESGDDAPEQEAPRMRLSAAALERALDACDNGLQRASVEGARLRAAHEHGAGHISTDALHAGLHKACTAGQRCVFIHILTLPQAVVMLRLASDQAEPQMTTSGIALAYLTLLEVQSGLALAGAPKLWQDLSRELLAPLLAGIDPGDTVVLCTPRELAQLPWHALDADGQPWNARNPIAYAPSGSDLARAIGLPWASGTAVVIGDPHGNLPRARDEARMAAVALGVDPLLGSEATVAAVHAALGSASPALIHFACHGMADPADSMRSALLLAPASRIDDGRLSADALYNATLTGTRAVLSACDSAVNGAKAEEEPFCMPNALLAAGARSVIGSLWKADDSATYMMMRKFYELLPSKGAAGALAQAQAWLRTCTIADLLALVEALIRGESHDDTRARLLLDKATEEVRAKDFDAAQATLQRLLTDTAEDAAAPEHARARHFLGLIRKRSGLPTMPNYQEQPFADVKKWAPFVLIGDWR